jgi:hypothetical protein
VIPTLAPRPSKRFSWQVLLLLTACGSLHGPSYEGEPLATFKGHLTAPTWHDSGEIRLALAWYPQNAAEGVGSPAGIVTQDLVYRGSFPLSFAFDVFQPPLPQALGALGEGARPGRGAFGFLIAYEDLNGNGRLDTIPVAGAPVDRVLGVSLDLFESGTGYAILYVAEQGDPADPLMGTLAPGFNLLELEPEGDPEGPLARVVPLSTPIPIALTGENRLNFFVCEAIWRQEGEHDVTPCGITFPHTGPDALMVMGMLLLDERGAQVQVSVLRQDEPVPGTVVRLDGREIPELGEGSFELIDPSGLLLRPGTTHLVTLSIPGEGSLAESVKLPGDFQITSPGLGAVLPAAQRFTAQWTAAQDASHYFVGLSADTTGFGAFEQTTLTSAELELFEPDTATLSVRAMSNPFGRIAGMHGKSVRLTFEP